MTSFILNLDRTPRTHGLLPAALVAGCLVWGALLSSAFGDEPGSGNGDSGGDPTVGTLPMTGDTGRMLDQTLTLCGSTADLRYVVNAGGEGFVDVIPLEGGNALMRFYGDVRVELPFDLLAVLEVGIWAGFEGGGMAYAVGTPEGFTSSRTVESGYSIELDPIRFANTGLLDEPMAIHAFHRSGVRTKTTLELDPVLGTVVFYQDV